MDVVRKLERFSTIGESSPRTAGLKHELEIFVSGFEVEINEGIVDEELKKLGMVQIASLIHCFA